MSRSVIPAIVRFFFARYIFTNNTVIYLLFPYILECIWLRYKNTELNNKNKKFEKYI